MAAKRKASAMLHKVEHFFCWFYEKYGFKAFEQVF